MNNSLERYAIEKIKRDSKCKPQCIGAIIGPTGPTGPTGPQGIQGLPGGTYWASSRNSYINNWYSNYWRSWY